MSLIFVEIVGVLMNQLRISKDFKKECKRGHANELETLLSATHVSRELPHNVTKWLILISPKFKKKENRYIIKQ